LDFKIGNNELLEIFKGYNAVSAVVIKKNGRSAGYGFVELDSVEVANKAISELDGQAAQGRNISVKMANK